MKKIVLFLPLLAISQIMLPKEVVKQLPFGDMETWTVRYIQESNLIGGNTRTLYCLAPKDTIRKNEAYVYGRGGNPWSSSNAYAKVCGIEKAACTTVPERRSTGGTCCRLDVKMQEVTVMGMIDVKVLVSGTLFYGRTIEPIKSAKDPYQNIDFGRPYTKRPKALSLDYKCVVSPEQWVWYAKGLSAPKKQTEHDECEVYMFLQKRWEDADGKIHAVRVGTAYERFAKTVPDWVNGHRIAVHYGDITHENWYKSYMGFCKPFRTMNSKGKMVHIDEEGWDGDATPTHMILMITSSKFEAFIGHAGNALWVDNVRLVYDE